MTHQQIREKFLKFFESKGHTIVPSSSLLPENDPTTLFTGSGMQPILPYLLGEKHPLGTRIVNSQKCFRAEDIGEVGDNRHTTFFEMLGNWSFGDYWKEDQLPWIFEFLTEKIGIDPNRLYVTVFAGDKENNIPRDLESPAIWKKLFASKNIDAKEVDLLTLENASEVGIQGGRIFFYGSQKNWWSRTGNPSQMPAGEPGGPDSEMFYQFDVPHDPAYGKECHPNCDCGRFLEIGNSVFMEYQKLQNGSFELLKQRNVDFGGGLERMTAAAQNKSDVFLTDAFEPLIKILPSGTDIRIQRIIADHSRAIAFLIADGAVPSNKGQGYVLRRLIRRLIVHAYLSQIDLQAIKDILNSIVQNYGGYYPNLNPLLILTEFDKENDKFRKTFRNGLHEMDKLDVIDSASAFRLFESFGLPYEIVKEVGGDKAVALTREGFDEEFKKHQEISRAGAENKFGGHGMKPARPDDSDHSGGEGEASQGSAEETQKKTRLHTATHLVVAALEKVLSEPLKQAGADINVERLRFDFAFPRKVTSEEIQQAEQIANKAITDDLEVWFEELPLEEAFASGAHGAFAHKYPPRVKVYTVGPKEGYFSREICGGPHVFRTSEIGHIKIIKEESVSGGNRRIRAVIDNI